MDKYDRQLNRPQPRSVLVRAGTVVFTVATLGMIVLTLVSDRGLFEVHRKADRLAALEQQLAEVEAENAALLEEIRTLRHDPAEIERRAREELKLVRPGEVILVVPDSID